MVFAGGNQITLERFEPNQLMRLTKSLPKQEARVSIALASSFPARNQGGHVGVSQGLEFMVRNFSRPIQLEDVVKASKMSRRGFCKIFKKKVGINPGLFLRCLRAERAKLLLIQQDLKLREIAALCGYRSENTFCVAFLREVGMSPKKFQREYLLSVCHEYRQANIRPAAKNRMKALNLSAHLPQNFYQPYDAATGMLTV